MMTSFPASDSSSSSSSDGSVERRTRRAEVPTSLQVTGVLNASPRQPRHHAAEDNLQEQPAIPVSGDGVASPSPGSEEAEGLEVGSSSASPLTLDLPDCFDVPSRVGEGSRLLNSASYQRIVHPLDRGMLLSFAVSVVYLAAALVAVCPTLVVVCVALPLAVVVRRLVIWCCGGGAPVEAYDDYGMRMFDSTPLSGHEEFWVTHRDAVTQCLLTFDGHIGVDRMRQLVEERLLIDGKFFGNPLFVRRTLVYPTSRNFTLTFVTFL